jgi:uncharacterized membrane protein
MWIARRRLADDLERWRAHGWVTAEGEVYVKRDLLERHHGLGLPAVLAILGVVLLGFAAMSFVAANWQDMPRLLRLAIIFAGLGGAYSAAAGLFVRGTDAFAHSAILLGVAVFGSGIMLIAQMYHIEGHPPDAMLVWALGALAAGVLVRSNPPLAASTLLFGIWSGWGMGLSSTIHWPLLAAAAAVSVAFALNRWWPGLHLVATLLTGWLIATGYVVKGDAGQWAVVVIGLAVAMTALFAAHRSRTEALGTIVSDVSAAVLGYAMIAAFAGLWALQFFERNDTASLVLFAAGTVSLLIVAIHQGLKLGFRGVVWLGYAGFSAEIFALYVKSVGSLLGSSLFFLVAGLIVIALAAVAWRLHRIGGGETAGGDTP